MNIYPLCIILFLIFLTLKLAQAGLVATWSWWIVTSPLWAPFVFVFFVGIFFACTAYILACLGVSRFKR